MTDTPSNRSSRSRRQFLKSGGQVAAATTLVTATAGHVHAAEDNEIRVALIGCGGRGTGAAKNALSVDNGPIKLVALGDVFDKNLKSTHASLSGDRIVGAKVDVPEDQKFIGFDAYQKAMDCLRPGDVVVLATPPGFRWVHFAYAIEKGLNVFMEKPVTVDGPTSKKMLELNGLALQKNLKVAVGLMCRHCKARQELFDRIQNGEIGDLTMLRAYRMAGPTGSAAAPPNDTDLSDLMHQIKHFHGFLWLSGGAVSDFLIHNIDESCWMKNEWPVRAIASGGRHYRGEMVDQNFDNYSMEYTFADGTKLFVEGRTMPGCKREFASFAHGTKGLGVISSASHWPARSRTFDGHNIDKERMIWNCGNEPKSQDPYQVEWNDLIAAIREDSPYNELERGVMASAVTSMGRMAAHTGQEITLDGFMNNGHQFAPGIEKLTLDSESPLKAKPDGTYSVPMPGLVKNREYL